MGDEADALTEIMGFDEEDFRSEMRRHATLKKSPTTYGTKGTVQRGQMVAMKCHCGGLYQARAADLERGWGYSCSKSCAAIRRDFGRPRAKRVPVASQEQGK
jgi:hypothetical protein